MRCRSIQDRGMKVIIDALAIALPPHAAALRRGTIYQTLDQREQPSEMHAVQI